MNIAVLGIMNVIKTIGLGVLMFKGATALISEYSNGISYTALPIRKGDIKLFKETIDFRLLVTNKNAVPQPIEKIKGIFRQGEYDLGQINSSNVITLQPKKTKELKFQSTIIAENFLFRLSEIIKDGGLLEPVKFTGKFVIAGKELPLTKTFKFVQ